MLWKWLCNLPRINNIKSKYVSSCCTGFHKPCLDVSSPPDLLPSPVVCVRIFLPFVLQDIFIKAAISKLPFIKAKQVFTNIREQRGGLQTPSPAAQAALAQRKGGRWAPPAGPPPLPAAAVTHFTNHMATHSFGQPQHIDTICMHLNINSFISQIRVLILWQSESTVPQSPASPMAPTPLLAPLESVLGGTLPSVWVGRPLPSTVMASAAPHF